MPRKRSPDSAKAETLYRKGMKLPEIADRLGVPASTVRRWKATQKWDDQKPEKALKSARKPSTKASAKPSTESERKPSVQTDQKEGMNKGGAPYGNVNSVGHMSSSPPGNQNAVTHGGYRAPNRDLLSPDELAMIDGMEDDPETQLVYQIQMYTISERRLMQAINKLSATDNKKGSDGTYIEETTREQTKREFESEKEEADYRERVAQLVEKGERLPGNAYRLITVKRSTFDPLARLQQQLTTVQSKKVDALKTLQQLRMDRKKTEAEQSGDDAVNIWARTLMELEGGGADD